MKQYQVTGQDLFNSIAEGYNSNSIMQYVIRLKGKINYELLKKAVDLSIIEEPVLGCQFRKNSKGSFWESIESDDVICHKIITDELENAIDDFLQKELSPKKGAQVLVYLICGKENDTVCVKIGHTACDGCGSKYYIKLLAKLYTKLVEGRDYELKANVTERSTDYLYLNLGIKDKEQFFQPELAELTSTWGFPRDYEAEVSKFKYKLKSFEKIEFESLYRYAKNHNTTINSIILAAYYCSLLKTIEDSGNQNEKEIQVMIDLRKYLPAHIRQTICNLSAAININLPIEYNNDLEKIIYLVTNEMERVKTQKNFIHSAIAVDLASEKGYEAIRDFYISEWEEIKATGKCTPMLSNLGVLSQDPIYFGEVVANEVDYVSPSFYAPAIMLGVCTYCSRLTLSISYYSPEISEKRVENLLENISGYLNNLVNVEGSDI